VNTKRQTLILLLLVTVALFAVAACAQAPASAPLTAAPTAAQAAASTKAPEATKPPPTPTAIPATPTPLPPTATPVPPTATKAPEATATTAATQTTGSSINDLLAKIQGNTEYSFDLKLSASAESALQQMNGKGYVKGSKVRMEMAIAGQQTTMLLDNATKMLYIITDVNGEKTAMKVDASQLAAQGQVSADSPTKQLSEVIGKSKQVGTEVVDGKPATVYEMPGQDNKGSVKFWVWMEKGVPLKVETKDENQKTVVTVEYLNYQFAPQPDSLFQLPPDVKVVE